MDKKFRIVLGMAAAVTAFSLTGCTPAAMSDKELKEEVQEKLYNELSDDMDITSFTVDERKTDKKNQTDIAYVTVDAQNEQASIERHYLMDIYLYDGGWSVESIIDDRKESWSATPLEEPDAEMVQEHVNLEIVDSEFLPEEMKTVYYTAETREYTNWTDNITYAATFVFDGEDLSWKYSDSETVKDERDWNVDGTWEVVRHGGMVAMGGSSVLNDYYSTRADITVENNTAYVHIYAYGLNPEYFNQDSTYEIDLSNTLPTYQTESIDFSETVPGYMPITVNSYLWFDNDTVAINGLYTMERVE